MSHRKHYRVAAVGLGVMASVASVGAWSTAKADTAQATTQPTDVVVTAGHATPMPANTSDKVTVLSLGVAQGRYVVSAAGDLVNFDPSDYTRCQLTLNGNQIGATSAMVGDGTRGTNGDSSLVVPITVQGGAVVGSGGGTLSLRCWHDTAGRAPYVDPGATLVVHRTGSLLRVTE